MTLTFPARYEALRPLGTGGGGEVWEVKDRHTTEYYALKVLAEDATEHEMAALVREAVALSGLEGLGVPRVIRFGRLPNTGRPFMVRELVSGKSLDELMKSNTPTRKILAALANAADQLTRVHRAGFFHGDVKPANIIVNERGDATLVDLGLAAPWRDAGTTAPGLTPKYAAPELLGGKSLTVRAEVYALGVALRETVERGEGSVSAALLPALLKIAQRATAVEPELRHPSADEFAVALRRVAGIEHKDEEEQLEPTAMWPIVGIDATAGRLVQAVTQLDSGHTLNLRGRAGSGRSVLLRRLAWSLGVEGDQLVWVDEFMADNAAAIEAEVQASGRIDALIILVDDADELEPQARDVIANARTAGARVVCVGVQTFGAEGHPFDVPPLGEPAALGLLKRAIPSLTDRMCKRIHASAMGLPGELKRFVGLLAQKPVVSDEDVDQLLFGSDSGSNSVPPSDPLTRALGLLARGRYDEAKAALELVSVADPLVLAVTRARLSVGLGDGRKALAELQAVRDEAEKRAGTREALAWKIWLSRAHIALAEYAVALELLADTREAGGTLGAESLAFEGLALSHIDNQDGAIRCLERAVQVAQEAGEARVTGLAWACLGLVLQRGDEVSRAEVAYREALTCAQNAGDASTLGTVQSNLAVLLKVKGDLAGAIEHFEAAVDMGKRSGRRFTVRHALIQLANADIYLGRLARARVSIEQLEAQRDELPAQARAQLSGLQAELMGRVGDAKQAVRLYQECASAYEKLGSAVDGAEARLEGVLVAVLASDPDVPAMTEELARAKAQLGETLAHRALVHLAAAKVALVAGADSEARDLLDLGVTAAREADQRDWIWRLLAARAEHEERNGQTLMARRDRTEAVTVLEEIAARLPRDLREVFWNDPRRRELRAKVDEAMGHAATRHALGAFASETPSRSVISSMISTPLEQRLARLLELNRDLLSEFDLGKLTAKVVGYAVELLQAERGFVILRDADGGLVVHSSSTRPGDIEHQQFSRSIAERVMDTREPIVSMQARSDARMQGYTSVHQMSLESVACVPIMGRYGEPTGALYVETRRRPGKGFEGEIPTLRVFADQVALAIETARLVSENLKRADELTDVNERLVKAQERLRELLGDRTEQLKRTREKLRHAQDTLNSHFGYHGIVGSSVTMRRCYALIDRVKDTDVPVLITGESGTGKEVVARAIHRASSRSKAPFLGVNCGAIPENLLESELFGHVRGAFTGADRDRKGLLRDATGGTVLLDEIGEMPQKMQAGLLRVLQERKVRPVGGTREESVDCRFLFATHRNLREMVDAGKFREDLFYRIHVVELGLPALRDRVDDLPLLVDHFLGIFAARYKRERGGVTKEAVRRLSQYSWPGNVRQLEHVLLNAWIMSETSEVDAQDLEVPDEGRSVPPAREPSEIPRAQVVPQANPPSGKGTLSEHRRTEKQRIIEALEAANWNRVKAAELSGIPRRTFYRRLREYNIQ